MTPDSTTDSAIDHLSHVPQMHAEAGYDEVDSIAPLRFSGFVCLLLGLISPVAMLGLPAMVIPIAALLFGAIALRPSPTIKPVGTTPAKIGLLLAIGFGFSGYFLAFFKTQTLGEQAMHYSRQYMEVIARDYDVVGMELQKDFRNRFNETMPLEDYYEAGSEETERTLGQFQSNTGHVAIRQLGPNAEWVLDRPVRIYKQFGIDRADLVWRSVENGKLIQFFMQYQISPSDVGEWHVDVIQEYRERIVAESIL